MAITNLVTNGDFETGSLTGWTNWNDSLNEPWTVTTTSPHGGTYAATWSESISEFQGRLVSAPMTVLGLRWYDVSVYLKGGQFGNAAANITIHFYNSAGRRITLASGLQYATLFNGTVPSSWTAYSSRVRVPANAVTLEINIESSGGSGGKSVTVDDVSVVAVVPPLLGDTPQFHVVIHDDVNMVGIKLKDIQHLRRLPSGPGSERKSIVQQSWAGGRGQQRMSTDMSRFYDSGRLWSMVEGNLISGPLCKYTPTGIRTAVQSMPGSLTWQRLYFGSTRMLTKSFVPTANFSADKFVLILRRVGNPGNATISLCPNNSGDPDFGNPLKSLTVGTSGSYVLTDLLSQVVEGDFSGTQALVNGTTYWITFDAGSQTDATNYWEVGTNAADTTGESSVDGGTWATGANALYYRILDAGTPIERVHYFEYRRAFYAATQPKDQTAAGVLYLNGDRGVAKGAQTTGTLKDDARTWTTNEWAGCVAVCIKGTNKGLARLIASNTSDTLTLTTAWPVACATGAGGTEYVILGSSKWTAITSGLTAPVTSVCVSKEVAYMAQGDGVNIRRFRDYNNAGTFARDADTDGTNKATFLLQALAADGTSKVWRVKNDTVASSKADAQAWGVNLSFDAESQIGDLESQVTSLFVFDGDVWTGKDDSLWRNKNNIWSQVNIDIAAGRDGNNGVKMRGWNTNLYFPFMDGFERLYGQVVDDIGPNRDEGMPPNRRGRVADFRPVLQYGYVAWDGGDSRYSAILATTAPGGGWHELHRAPTAGKRITSLFYQSIPLLGNRLWFSEGEDIAYLVMPDDTHTPLNDSTMEYAWESWMVSSWVDDNTPSLDHLNDEIRLFTRNLSNGAVVIDIDYQTDDANDSSAWLPSADQVTTSPYQAITVGDGRVTGRRARFRARMQTNVVTTPVVVNATDYRLVTMNEVLYNFSVTLSLEDSMMLISGGDSTTTLATIVAQLEAWQEDATTLTFESVITPFGLVKGRIDPVSILPVSYAPDEKKLAGSLTFLQT